MNLTKFYSSNAYFLTFFICLVSSIPSLSHAFSVNDTELERVSQSKQWHRLMHYVKSFPLQRWISQVDGQGFFFSENGKNNPKAELIATLEAFEKNTETGKLKQPPQCAFPERYRFLKKEFNLQTLDVVCPKLQEFMDSYHGSSATLVFSSAYPNNPGSMFGHTFLRINRKSDSTTEAKKLDILDFGISFAAAVGNDENGFAFMFLGLTGGYLGQFSKVPYYVKVNEYTNSESRDVWEYDLNLNEEETQSLLRHVWEIETNSYFDYFFFDENCAYVLLGLLEVAKPDWNLSDFWIYVIPGETVKRLVQTPGAVTNVKFRPSLRKKMMRNFSLLNPAQQASYFRILSQEDDVSQVSDLPTIEGVISYLYYLKQKKGAKFKNSSDEKKLTNTLIRRSELGTRSKLTQDDVIKNASSSSINDFEDSRPEMGHHPRRLGISAGLQRGAGRLKEPQFFQELSFKFAFHDLLNEDIGYSKFSQIDFPGATLRYTDKDQNLYLENFQALAITSLSPLTHLEKSFSWRMMLDYYSPKDLRECNYCHLVRFEGGGGSTLELFTPHAVFYGLILADIEAGSSLRKGFRMGPKFQLATLINPHPKYKIQLLTNWVTDLFQSDRPKSHLEFELNQSIAINQSFEIRGIWNYLLPTDTINQIYSESKITFNYYF